MIKLKFYRSLHKIEIEKKTRWKRYCSNIYEEANFWFDVLDHLSAKLSSRNSLNNLVLGVKPFQEKNLVFSKNLWKNLRNKQICIA